MFADFNDDKNDDFLDEFRQKLNADSNDGFEERKNEINRSKNVFIGTVSGIALAAVVGWFVLSSHNTAETGVDIPVVRRPQTAVKIQPAEPGGMEILNQDKSVYNIIEKKEVKTPVMENLLPPPEEPQLPVVAAVAEPSNSEQQAQKIIEDAENKIVPPAPEPKAAPAEKPAPEPISIASAATEVPAQPEVEAKAPPKAETPALKAEVKVEPKLVAVSGPWQIQLISSPNRKAVDTAWDNLVKKYPVLKDQPREIETANLGAKGTFYRLKAGGFADRSGADRLCNDIKALGGTCIVKKK